MEAILLNENQINVGQLNRVQKECKTWPIRDNHSECYITKSRCESYIGCVGNWGQVVMVRTQVSVSVLVDARDCRPWRPYL